MNFNYLLIPTLVIAGIMFWMGHRFAVSCKSLKLQVGLFVIALLASVPAFLMVGYYCHIWGELACYYQYRSIPYIELSAGLCGLLGGVTMRYTSKFQIVTLLVVIFCIFVVVFIPFLKPILLPLDYESLRDRWEGDVCKQTSGASCGAASAATILRHYGISASEAEIARECFTYSAGTENWYIARALRSRGLLVSFRTGSGLPDDLKTPAIAGVKMGGVGHFIVILQNKDGNYITGDPLVGMKRYSRESIMQEYHFTGFFMEVSNKANNEGSANISQK